MAKLTESVIGKLSGKIGQVVGATWKGIAVLKVLLELRNSSYHL